MLLHPLLHSHFHRFGLPGLLLVSLLQRTPVLRVLTGGAERLAAAPASQLLRSLFTATSLGAVHSLAGATAYVQNPSVDPVPGNIGVPLSVAFTYTGTPSPPQYYRVSGQLPPGLNYIPAPVNGTVRSGTPVISGTPTVAGNYSVTIQGFGLAGNGLPHPINFAIAGDTTVTPPAITRQPVGQTVSTGAAVTFSVTATGSPSPTFQWWRSGTPLAGATGATLTIPNAQSGDAGVYSVVVSNSAGNVVSATATLTVVSPNATAQLSNLSVRTSLAAGELLTVGVVVADGARNILFRAAGPALSVLGVPGAMADPSLEVYRDQTRRGGNNNWDAALASSFDAVGAFAFPRGSLDAALVQNVDAAYSVQVQGPGPGVVLVEAYDTGAPSAARMVNVSALNRVGTGDEILIAGFTLSGTGSKPLLIRAVGPKLAEFGVAGALTDPKLEIYQGSTKLNENDNWAASLAPVFTSVGAFALTEGSRDAALVATLPPGSYTAQVSGVNGGTGSALIEIYELK